MPDEQTHGKPPASGERRSHTRRTDVRAEDLDALRAELVERIEDGDRRMGATVLTTIKSELDSHFAAFGTRLDALGTQVSEHTDYVRTAKAEDAEEERLRHEAAQKALWLAEMKAAADAERAAKEKPRLERRERMKRIMPPTFSVLAGLGIGMGAYLFQNGIRWGTQLAIALWLYALIALVIVLIYRFG